MTNKNHQVNGSKENARGRVPNRKILGLLLIVVLGAVITIPWQRRQWDEMAKARSQRSSYETRLKDLETQKIEAVNYDSLLAEPNVTIEIRLEAARFYLSSGNTKRAAILLQQLEKDVAGNPELSKDEPLAGAISSLYERVGWQDKALFHAERALNIAPDSVDSIIRVAFLEALLGWQKDCGRHVKMAMDLAPNSAEPHLANALVMDQVGAISEAERELLLADRLRPKDWRIQLLIARNRMSQKRYPDALNTLEAATKLIDREPALMAARVDAYLQQIDRMATIDPNIVKKAESLARTYLELAPASPEAAYLLGRTLQLRGDPTGALKLWEDVYKRSPDTGKLRINLGSLLAKSGASARATQLMAESKREQDIGNEYHRLVTGAGQQRENPEIHRRLAIHCMAYGRLPRAIIEWNQVLKTLPNDKEAIEGIRLAKVKRGDM